MQKSLQIKLNENPKMKEYLKLNSNWYKDLNRSVTNYKNFEQTMKDIYKLRTTDKINDALENIDLISSVLNVIKYLIYLFSCYIIVT